MRKTDGEQERIQLEAELQEILDDIDSLQEELQVEVDPDAEEADFALAQRETNLALLRRMQDRLDSINAALRAIEKGLYGTCERCGEQIDPARLEVRPDATLCLDCQREVERLAKRGQNRLRV